MIVAVTAPALVTIPFPLNRFSFKQERLE